MPNRLPSIVTYRAPGLTLLSLSPLHCHHPLFSEGKRPSFLVSSSSPWLFFFFCLFFLYTGIQARNSNEFFCRLPCGHPLPGRPCPFSSLPATAPDETEPAVCDVSHGLHRPGLCLPVFGRHPHFPVNFLVQATVYVCLVHCFLVFFCRFCLSFPCRKRVPLSAACTPAGFQGPPLSLAKRPLLTVCALLCPLTPPLYVSTKGHQMATCTLSACPPLGLTPLPFFSLRFLLARYRDIRPSRSPLAKIDFPPFPFPSFLFSSFPLHPVSVSSSSPFVLSCIFPT